MLTSTPSAADPDELMTPAQVSKLAKLSVRTLQDQRSRGRGPEFVKLSPGRAGRVRYRRRDVYAWLANAARDGRPE